ncbi:hypothetical protein [Lentzea jiangxiensis]|uniref:hypothetical protein n=1 Tax=Lentzea jiangxiensis TaxID=641025 RepID=UPI0015A0DA9E|nr:hypothetical protein [Lentzea jiangxiensis]
MRLIGEAGIGRMTAGSGDNGRQLPTENGPSVSLSPREAGKDAMGDDAVSDDAVVQS